MQTITLRNLVTRLMARYEQGEARAIVRLLLEKRTSLSWTDILCGGLEALDGVKKEEIEHLIKRLEAGEPIQYVLGEADFYGRTFHVESGVLIPRLETEVLVAEVLASANCFEAGQQIRILDVGTGSGCIAISVALELEKQGCSFQIDGVDKSDDALRIASFNAESLGAKDILFQKIDILEDKQTDVLPSDYSIIVSNPPYICNKERAEMEQHVLEHEPEEALFVPDDDPLMFYRAITDFATRHLRENGKLLFEVNRAYSKETAVLMENFGFRDVRILKDQFGNDRVVYGLGFNLSYILLR